VSRPDSPKKTWIVVPYRTEWPELFAREAALLGRIFARTDAVIEHIGSTAVPGLGAKPIIDIMIGVTSLAEAESRVDELASAEYQYVPEYESELPERRYFRKPFYRPRTHHLHIVVYGSEFWLRHILFRDYLRAHADVADAYYALKQRLSAASRENGADYVEAKTPFVTEVLALAARHGNPG
jgi:GrpB-like predicted nucleotidyltransferase (UPF0157 family)